MKNKAHVGYNKQLENIMLSYTGYGGIRLALYQELKVYKVNVAVASFKGRIINSADVG